MMDVFVVPVGRERYELYCEIAPDDQQEPEAPAGGFVGRLRQRFSAMVRAAEQQRPHEADRAPAGWMSRLQERTLAWVAERIAEQRLLWNLRKQTRAVAVHPQDMDFDSVMALIRRMLRQDHERHRRWLAVHAVLLTLSGVLAIVPGPNLLAYYFAFRVVGHYFSMRGAAQGLRHVEWSGRPCPPLTDLRDAITLEPAVREARVHAIAERLRLQHLSTFVERVAVRA